MAANPNQARAGPDSEFLSRFHRVKLTHLPTSLERLERLGSHLGGPNIFVKRDDCTGLALGGNKSRKLEFAMGEALAQGADTIVSAGPLQSNHVRQTAAACARLGLNCELVLSTAGDWHEPGPHMTGNRLLVELLGAKVTTVETEFDRPAAMEKLAKGVKARGGAPYLIPAGASNAVGALGYAGCAVEIAHQCGASGVEPDAVIVASGSGGTQGGLVAGMAALNRDIRVVGIDIDAVPDETLRVARECAEGAAQLMETEYDPASVHVVAGYAGEAYGEPTRQMIEAVRLLAGLEGLLLDPVYSGKAMAGLIDLVSSGEFGPGDNIVFIHTGGYPGIFVYADDLTAGL